ncbi:uncharacterized protein LOC108192873 isoform X2 [Daucus carota subsp. sativus]|uniref:uncharacterized protein LOC108192873 isoform X2 n=1 Tax=Daucus carota subsp. sativus TaxID=79200 RepID=UPI0007EF3388|nr:PREDICTED: aminoacyl tRNA synthase complex-interacting multifunctional protein 1 isoform X2 [Daucus carota subsp. sativus]
MAASNQIQVENRNRNIVLALCKRLSLDPKLFLDDKVRDLTSLCGNVLKASAAVENSDELTKWISFAETFPVDSEACLKVLNELNGELIQKSVLVGRGIETSAADIIVFSVVQSSVIGLPDSDRKKLPHLMRWIDYIQNKENISELFEQITVNKAPFELPVKDALPKVEVASNTKKAAQGPKDAGPAEMSSTSQKTSDSEVKVSKGVTDKKKETTAEKKKETTAEKKKETTAEKKMPEKAAVEEKDKELDVSLLKIQVGLIRKAYKHPSADSLLVEEIDVGEPKLRQVVSGLAKYCTPDQLTNRLVVLITNVKPGKLRDVMSQGLVLCASSEDHTLVEPLIVPDGAKPGEFVSFSGHDGKPEDVLNPKKKQLEKITPNLFTDEKGIATFKGIPFMTSTGPCTSSILKGSIK